MELKVFNNELFGEIRFMQLEGKIYAVANDVAKALGYSRPNDAINQHCKGTVKHRILTNGGNQMLNIIPEGDIYRLIIKSKLSGAEKFERWVFDEVLPQIRMTGGYMPIKKEDDELTIMAKAFLIAQKTIENKDKLIEQLEPKAEIYDRFIDKEATWGFRDLRKELESTLGYTIKENELKEVMRSKGWIGQSLKALSYAIRNKYMVTKDIEDRYGNPRVQDRFTSLAREELLDYFKNK